MVVKKNNRSRTVQEEFQRRRNKRELKKLSSGNGLRKTNTKIADRSGHVGQVLGGKRKRRRTKKRKRRKSRKRRRTRRRRR